jgi:hypothetical protein
MAFMSVKIKFWEYQPPSYEFGDSLEWKIKFGKELSTFKFIQKIINDWNGKLILDGYFVESMKLGHMHQVPSFFSTMTTGDE